MEKDEIIKIKDTLWELCEPWKSVTQETIESLGKEDALHIMDFHGGNWIDIINKWIPAKYSDEEQDGIIFWQFYALFKEIIWLQFLFQTGNYSLVHKDLRYILEMMAQAHYIDIRHSDLTFEEQIEKAIEIEDNNVRGWNLVNSALCNILRKDEKHINIKYRMNWDCLNKYVHPSAKRKKIIDDIDPSSHFIDSYNEDLARNTLKIVDEIFDAIYLIIFSRFPCICDLLLNDNFADRWTVYSPDTIKYINWKSKLNRRP
jgi:hypothetical protein